ncbi:MAG: OsmC family protein [Gemmatimonadaceae bacterium]
MTRRSTAVWRGTGKEGSGTLDSTSGVLKDTPYSFATRFVNEDGRTGTNPEELIAAAHAGCFSMALAFQLAGAGHVPDELKTTAHVTVEQGSAGFEITGITLELIGKVPGITAEQFQQLAEAAKAGCPVSKALKAVPITLRATLSG